MGLRGDQIIDRNQNRTLDESKINDVDLHLFEKFSEGDYTYMGRV